MRTNKRLWTWIVALVMLVGVLAPQAYAVDEPGGTTVSTNPIADDSTLTQWTETIGENSMNAGRIWTDKTVQTDSVTLTGGQDGPITITKSGENASFLVGLSALSSATTSTTTQSQPLDVVLVLDVSGSMDDNMVSYSYKETYNIRTGWGAPTYCILLDGRYVEVQHESTWDGGGYWYYTSRDQGIRVSPKTSANDPDSSHVQFYEQTSSWVKKLTALKTAVNGLIDYTNELNASITDENQKHRIALVKYAGNSNNAIGDSKYTAGGDRYNYSQVVEDFTTDAQQLEDSVNGLTADGATRADYGMEQARRLVNGGTNPNLVGKRPDAKVVVIFFTDGVPTSYSDFSDTVANGAVSEAKTLKDGGATIYSVGIFAGADPSYTDIPGYYADKTQKSNAFMHAVSSNFPNATSYTNRGQRAPDSDYYLATQDSEELNEIFQAIIEDFVAAASPTVVVDNNPTLSGYITFTDELGPYMEVKDFNSVVYAGQEFTQKSVNAAGTEYTFTGAVSGNPIYGSANLSDLVIEVQKSTDAAQGDIVTVKVPASLIPLRYYDVKEENGTLSMEINPAYPIRVFYSVGLKSNVLTDGKVNSNVVDPGYIAANTDVNGNVKFYANKYTTGNEYGDAEATFYPAATNAFYYYTENTPLYTDADCTQRASDNNKAAADGNYYYQITYYEKGQGDSATQKPLTVAVKASDITEANGYLERDDQGYYYVPAGKHRASRADDYRTPKTANNTGTATAALYPTWETDAEGKEVASIHLGNNGVLTAPKPTGNLTISKTVEVEAASGLTAPANAQFTFTVSLKDASNQALTGSYAYTGDTTGTISNDGTLTLTAGQSVTIEDLPVGTQYTVTETNLPAGFTVKTGISNPPNGTIEGGQTKTAAFTNTYSATPYTLNGAANLTVTKVLDGRNWQAGDAFTFKLEGADDATTAAIGDAIEMPATTLEISGATAQAGESVTGAFGNITFKKPGEYKFKVSEVIPAGGKKDGVTYDAHEATITVKVTDNGQGALVADVTSEALTFTNTYAVDDTVTVTSADLKGTKKLTGRNSLLNESFTFTLTQKDGPQVLTTADTASVTGLTDGVAKEFNFGDITFSETGTYTFEVTENLPAGAENDPYMLNGVTYDHHTGTVTVEVTDVNPKTKLQDGKLYAKVNSSNMDFVNSYAAAPVTYGGVGTLLGGTKTLNDTVGGHPLTEGMFTFTMTAQKDDGYPLPQGAGVTYDGTTVAKVSNTAPANGQNTATYDFGELTFTKAGTYAYYIAEVRNTLPGVNYDPTLYEVKFTVSDDQDGQLNVTASAKKLTDSTGGTTSGTDVTMEALDFTNTYSAGPVPGSTTIQKTLDGRNFREGDQFVFNVTMTAKHQGGADMTNDELPQPTAASGGTIDNVKAENNTLTYTITINPTDYNKPVWQFNTGKFTYSQVGTYVFNIQEQNGSLKGVTYDSANYQVTVTITETKQEGGQPVLHRDIAITKDGTPFTGSTISFTNTYAAEGKLDGATNLMVTKKLTGREWLDSDTFTFTLEGKNDTTTDAIGSGIIELPANATGLAITTNSEKVDAESYKAAFGDITFKKAGDYVFLISEVDDGLGGMEYAAAQQIIVSVKDNGNGTLTAELETTGTDTLTFVNNYKADPVSLVVIGHKNILDKVIEPADTTATEDQSTETTTEDESTEATTEDESTEATTEDKATVTTPEDETAKVTAEDKATVTTPEDETAKVTAEDKAAVTTPEDETSGDKAAEATNEDESTVTTTEDEPAEAITEDKAPETTIEDKTDVAAAEDESAAAATVAAPTAATEIRTTAVTTAAVRPAMATATRATTGLRFVNITDNTTPDEDAGTEAPEVAPLNLNPSIQATMQFSYEMVKLDEQGHETTESKPATSTGANDFNFPVLEFDHPGEYKYVIREVERGAKKYIEYDESEYILTVTVTDDNEGQLHETHTLTLNGAAVQDNKPVFTNYYSAQPIPVDVSANLNAKKVLNGRTMKAGEFTFQITDENDEVVSEGTNNADGSIQFESWYYTMDETGTHTYTVSEVTDNLPQGVSAQGGEYTFTVTVSDDNQGTLTAQVNNPNQNIVFTNTYTATDATVQLTASKILTGKALGDQEFSFTLQDENGQVLQEKKNDANGTVTFDPLTYTLTDLGGETEKTFHYVVAEVNDGRQGMTYDETQYGVDVVVTDDGAGTLKTKVVYTANNTAVQSMIFTNSYQPLALEYQLPQGTKTLNGRALADGEFQFVVEMQDTSDPAQPWKWNQISETVNQGGNLVFDPVKVTKAGNYTLRVREVNNNLSGVTYDTSVYYLTMTVYDDNGQLKADNVKITRGDIGKVGTEEASISFVNTYTAPVAPDDGSDDDSTSDPAPAATPAPTATPTPAPAPTATPAPATVIPQTGDAMPIATLVVVMIVAAVLLVGLVVMRKRRNK